MFFPSTKKHALIYNILLLGVVIFVVTIIANMFVKQQTYSSATGAPQPGDTYTKNVFTSPFKKKK